MYFDNVEVFLNYMIVGFDKYKEFVEMMLVEVNLYVVGMVMGVVCVVYEYVYVYVYECR